jgi:hypothetical protein
MPKGPANSGSVGSLSGVSHPCEPPTGVARDGQAHAGSSDKGAMQTRVTIQPAWRGCCLDEESRISSTEGVLGSSRSSL